MRDTDVDSIMMEYDVSRSMACEIPLSASIVYVPWTGSFFSWEREN